MTPDDFDKLTIRDFENGAVRDEIWKALRDGEKARQALEQAKAPPCRYCAAGAERNADGFHVLAYSYGHEAEAVWCVDLLTKEPRANASGASFRTTDGTPGRTRYVPTDETTDKPEGE